MKKRISFALVMSMVVSMMLPFGGGVGAVRAEDNTGKAYEEPASPAVTYNMNLDWKFFDTHTDKEIWTAMASADKNGKKFYEKDYDDSEWETVSIPHGIGGGTNSFANANMDAGGGYRSVLLYRKTFTVPEFPEGGKLLFELEGIRQSAYVWVNGEKVGYYEAGITAMGFDISKYVKSGEEAVVAICNDGITARGTTGRIPYETVPGEEWGSSYTPDNYKTTVGTGAAFVWNTKDFNEPQIGLVYNAYLHTKAPVYQTLPLYNNLKTTGNYIYADNFNIREQKATIHVDAEVRNESSADGKYTLEVNVVDPDGILKYSFESAPTEVKKAADAGVVYQTAVESDVYSAENVATPTGITKANTPDVTYISASFDASDMRFWSMDDPYLYTVYTVLKDESGTVVDVQKKDTGFRKVTYDETKGVLINDRAVWMPGYAQRSTNEWAVIGVATDWLQDYDMQLLKENNANFIRWMHVAPKPAEVRSSDRYGVAIACPAGDKEGVGLTGRQWSQRAEAMRDAIIYFRNSPSVIFWETGNSAVGSAANANDMARIRDELDSKGMRFIGARSTKAADQMNYEYNYAGTMYNRYADDALAAMKQNGKPGPIMETEYARGEAPRRVWDLYSPPDYDYINKHIGGENKKEDGFDVWNFTQEDAVLNNISEYHEYYSQRAGGGINKYSAAAMMVWSDSNMHTRNTGTENCRTTGRVDPVRQKKEMFEGTRAAQATTPTIHIVGHWSYPAVSDDTYNYFKSDYSGKTGNGQPLKTYDPNTVLKRDPTKKTVYVIGSADVKKVELYRVDKDNETLIGTNDAPEKIFIYSFKEIDVTQGDAVIAKAYNARGEVIATDEIKRTYDAVSVRLTPHTAIKADENGETVNDWRADGGDIAYFDVEVVDKNGNVCALNYDRINFKFEGNGEYLGGYNSGIGAGCFQNMPASEGLSKYFDGVKDGVSTIGKNYVYAENGTNRIFVRSTREAGSFTLTASMGNLAPVSATITSTAVETTGGLTTLMPSYLKPGVKAPPVMNTTPAMKPLQLKAKLLSFANAIIEKDVDTNVYYDVYLNGEKLAEGSPTILGIQNALFGPIYPILQAAKAAGADFEIAYGDKDGLKELVVTKDGHTYQYLENRNAVLIDNTTLTECVDTTRMENGVMIANLGMMLGYAGIEYNKDDANKRLDITVSASK